VLNRAPQPPAPGGPKSPPSVGSVDDEFGVDEDW
jgi:hypothetical protein